MVVFTNHRLGPSAELLVSPSVAEAMLLETAHAAAQLAAACWERELVAWLGQRARQDVPTFDVSEIAWTPDHFEVQRAFLIAAIDRATMTSEHGGALVRWRRLIEAHPRDSVQFGRRWQWASAQTSA